MDCGSGQLTGRAARDGLSAGMDGFNSLGGTRDACTATHGGGGAGSGTPAACTNWKVSQARPGACIWIHAPHHLIAFLVTLGPLPMS